MLTGSKTAQIKAPADGIFLLKFQKLLYDTKNAIQFSSLRQISDCPFEGFPVWSRDFARVNFAQTDDSFVINVDNGTDRRLQNAIFARRLGIGRSLIQSACTRAIRYIKVRGHKIKIGRDFIFVNKRVIKT